MRGTSSASVNDTGISPGSSTTSPESVSVSPERARMTSAPLTPLCAPSRAAISAARGESPVTASVASCLAASRVSRNTLYRFLRPIKVFTFLPPPAARPNVKLILDLFQIYYVQATEGFQSRGELLAAPARSAGHRRDTGTLRGWPGDRYPGVQRGPRPPAGGRPLDRRDPAGLRSAPRTRRRDSGHWLSRRDHGRG